MDEGMLRISIFFMIFNLLFPVLVFGFTNIEVEEFDETYDISLDEEDLFNAGINFQDADSHNVTYEGGREDFEVSGQVLGIKWLEGIITGDTFQFKRPTAFEAYVGNLTGDFFSMGGEHLNVEINNNPYGFGNVHNVTIIEGWDESFNWTRIEILKTGGIALVTTLVSDDNNITKAVLETGTLTFTLGKPVSEAGSFSFGSFVSWYWGLLAGSKDYGLPASMAWAMRILAALQIFIAIVIARELLPFG